MKSIKFTAQELELLRNQYQLELVEAEKYIQKIKNIIEKLGVPQIEVKNPPKKKPSRKRQPDNPVEETPVKKSKRGRKPKEQSLPIAPAESILAIPEKVKKEKTPKKEKPLKSVPESVVEIIIPEPPKKKEVPKKKITRKSSKKRKGMVLKNLSKPLPKKDIKDSLPDKESQDTDKQ